MLDVFTGTGALAIAAAAAGAAEVTAVDLSVRAVLTARINSARHHAHVRVLRGDLFAPVAGRCFDLVTANPPYVPAEGAGLPRHRAARSWDAGPDGRTLLDRVAAEVGAVLAPGGTLLVTHSEVSGVQATLDSLADAGLEPAVVARRTLPFGPVMRGRADLLVARGLVAPGQDSEEVVVIAARWAAVPSEDEDGPGGPAHRHPGAPRPHRVTVTADGPVLLEGPVEVALPDGTLVRSERPVTALCVCGSSRRYPFCDTSHRRRVRGATPPDHQPTDQETP